MHIRNWVGCMVINISFLKTPKTLPKGIIELQFSFISSSSRNANNYCCGYPVQGHTRTTGHFMASLIMTTFLFCLSKTNRLYNSFLDM